MLGVYTFVQLRYPHQRGSVLIQLSKSWCQTLWPAWEEYPNRRTNAWKSVSIKFYNQTSDLNWQTQQEHSIEGFSNYRVFELKRKLSAKWHKLLSPLPRGQESIRLYKTKTDKELFFCLLEEHTNNVTSVSEDVLLNRSSKLVLLSLFFPFFLSLLRVKREMIWRGSWRTYLPIHVTLKKSGEER